MTNRWPANFKCPHCQADTAWEKPGLGATVAADVLATIVALPFFALGVAGFVVAVCLAMFGAMYWLHNNMWCDSCGTRIARTRVATGSGH
jgi:hypothetical protein